MNSVSAITPVRAATLAAAVALAGCSSFDGLTSGERVDYRSQSAKLPELEVPPDLTQLARDGRYQPPTTVVSANAMALQQTGRPAAAAAGANPVAPVSVADLRIERLGRTRWLVTPLTPEQLWPQLRSFWQERGFTLTTDSPEVGVMETDWAENRAKLPHDFIRSTLGKIADGMFSTSTLDRYRTRVERAADGTEVYISQRGLEEVTTGALKDSVVWQARPNDPDLEAEMLSRLMVRLGGVKVDEARAVVAAAGQPVPAPGRSDSALPDLATLEIPESFDRAWRLVGLALDRSGFTVEDRDRSAGLYFVRYVDPKQAGKDEPNFFSKLFSRGKDSTGPVRYRVVVKAADKRTTVSVQDSKGTPDNSENARRIIGRLSDEFKR